MSVELEIPYRLKVRSNVCYDLSRKTYWTVVILKNGETINFGKPIVEPPRFKNVWTVMRLLDYDIEVLDVSGNGCYTIEVKFRRDDVKAIIRLERIWHSSRQYIADLVYGKGHLKARDDVLVYEEEGEEYTITDIELDLSAWRAKYYDLY